ncbi:MAG: efflux RND transporter periplasmic adaptor subunit [bacterium]
MKTVAVEEGNIDVVVTATGKTDALQKVKVFSPIAGRILSLKVLEGTAVKIGQVVATIQTRESYAAIAGAEALLNAAQTSVAKEEAQRTLALAKATQSTVSVRAKLNGVVSMRNVSEGELVAENADLLTLLDLSTVVFSADVMLRDLPPLRIDQRSTIHFQSLPGVEFKARVDAINPQTDIQSQTVKVRLRFNDLAAVRRILKTDMVGTASIVIGTHKNALIIPKSALLRNDETNVFSIVIVASDSLAKTLPVTIGASTDSTVEILSADVQKGMSVITEGNYALTDSTKVAIVHTEHR